MSIDPNDYGAAAGYAVNDQGNYVNSSPSPDPIVDTGSSGGSTGYDPNLQGLFDYSSSGDSGNSYNYDNSNAYPSYGDVNPYSGQMSPESSSYNWNPFDSANDMWGTGSQTSPDNSYADPNSYPSYGDVNPYSGQMSPDTSSSSVDWWKQAGENLGSWWDQTTQDAGNWLGDKGVGETGYVTTPVSDAPLALEENLSPDKNIWFQDTGNGNFTAPWNPTGEDKKWIQETPSGLIFTPLVALGKELSLPTQGETAMSGVGTKDMVSADAPIPSSLIDTLNTKYGVTSTPSISVVTGGLKDGSSFVLSQGGTDQTFQIDKIERDSTGKIISAQFTNSKFPDQPIIYQGGNVIDEANRVDRKNAPASALTPPSQIIPPNSVTPAPSTDSGVQTNNLTKWGGDIWNNRQIWFGKITADEDGNQINKLGMFNTDGKNVTGFNYIDQTTGKVITGIYDISDPNHYKVSSLLDQNGQSVKDSYIKDYGLSLVPVAKALNEGKIHGEDDWASLSAKSIDNNHFLMGYATGEPTWLGQQFGLVHSGTLQAAVQNYGGAGNVAMDASKLGSIQVGTGSSAKTVFTYDPNSANADVISAMLHQSPQWQKDAQVYGFNPQTGEAYTADHHPSLDSGFYNITQTKGYGGWRNIIVPSQFDTMSENVPSLEAAKTGAFINSIGYTPGGLKSKTVLVMPEFTGSLAGQGGYEWVNQAPVPIVTGLSSGKMEGGNLQSNWWDAKQGKATPDQIAQEKAAGNELYNNYGVNEVFPMLNSPVYLKYNPDGSISADSSQNIKAMYAERGTPAMTAISGINFWETTPVMRDMAIRPSTPVDVNGVPMMAPWTWDSYNAPLGTLDNTSNAYIPVRLGGRQMAAFEGNDGQIHTITYETMSGDKNSPNYRGWLPSPGFKIDSPDGSFFAPAPMVTNPYGSGPTCTSCGGTGCTSCSKGVRDDVGYPSGNVYFNKHARKMNKTQIKRNKMSKGISC